MCEDTRMKISGARYSRSSENSAGPAMRPLSRERNEIPDRYKWKLEDIYENWDAWETDLLRAETLMKRYESLRGSLAEGPGKILEACRLSDELGILAQKVYRYPGLKETEDTRDNEIRARLGRVQNLFARFHQATAWYTPELLQIPFEKMREWLDETKELEVYRFSITETYRLQQHVLDEKGERLLAYAAPLGRMPAEIYSMLADADVRFPSITLSDGREVVASHAAYSNGLHSLRKQEDREALFKAHFSVFDEQSNTWAGIYHAVLQRDWFLARSRKYSTTLEAELDENAIPVSVVEQLIAKARTGAKPLRRYHRLRRAVLGLERYRYFDAYLPLVELEWPFPYELAAELVIASVAVFGGEYQATVKRAFEESWIDVYENEGKRSGAFSAGVYGVHPYMLLNYADTLNDAFTVAHEMGHSMHTVLSHASQPFATSEYVIFVAEVASMLNEQLLLDLLLEREEDPLHRIVLLQHAIDDIAAGFYRQTLFADFELQAHRDVEEEHPVTADRLQELYLGCLEAYFGASLDDQEWYRNTWARIPHFFHSPYYVYQYATSKAAATMIHRRLRSTDSTEAEEQRTTYLELLRAGGSAHPIDLLRCAGVDFSTPEPVDSLVVEMGRLVEKLEEELQKFGKA